MSQDSLNIIYLRNCNYNFGIFIKEHLNRFTLQFELLKLKTFFLIIKYYFVNKLTKIEIQMNEKKCRFPIKKLMKNKKLLLKKYCSFQLKEDAVSRLENSCSEVGRFAGRHSRDQGQDGLQWVRLD